MTVLAPLLRWWLLLEAVGLVGLPISMRLLGSLPERGACFRRVVGLLLSAYLYWMLVTIGLLRNTTAGAAVAVLLVAAFSLWLGRRDWPRVREQLFRLRRVLAVEALLFLTSLVLFGVFRSYNPEIAATEKPMEFAFLNGILQSSTFPPQDPWLAGYSISYYYFGYLISAMLTRLSALPSDVTFNLTGVTLFSLTVSGSFALVYNLAANRPSAAAGTESSAARYGVLGAAVVALMGNLEGVLELVRARGWGTEALWRWFDVRNLSASVPSSRWYPDDMWWWWRASRVIHDRDLSGATQEVISEFPFFSFLLGDNHPHVLALPFVLLTIALALNIALSERIFASLGPAEQRSSVAERLRAFLSSVAASPGDVALWGLILGALVFLNTWDFPIYLALFACSISMALYRRRSEGVSWLQSVATLVTVLVLVGLVAYLPFLISLRSQAGGIGLVPPHIKTQWQQFLLMFGVQLVLILGLLGGVTLARRTTFRGARPPVLAVVWGAALGIACVAALAATWWTAALCLALLGWAGTVLVWGISIESQPPETAEHTSLLMALLMIVMGLGLAVSVEFVYLRDVFDSRMNTVFKFYYQAWVLLSLAGAYGVHYLRQIALRSRLAVRGMIHAYLTFAALLILGGLSYTAAATAAKANAFSGVPTLDGTAYVARQSPMQYAVIQWLRKEAPPDAVIVEAAGGSYTAQNWISAHTGLQSLLGWAGHERQWRGSGDLPAERDMVVRTIYTGIDQDETLGLLQTYDVDYVIVGPDEREQYSVDLLVLEKLDALMVRCFQNDAYIVYGRAR